MADNRADTRIDMRTPLARVKGLGAAGHGATHWWVHRLTAVSNVRSSCSSCDHGGLPAAHAERWHRVASAVAILRSRRLIR
jgi:ribosomal protein S27AE